MAQADVRWRQRFEFGLDARARALLDGVFQRYPAVREVRAFGSRALGTHRAESDIDIALYGDIDDALAARIAGELDELPLPYQVDVRAYRAVQHAGLRGHIDRVGRTLFVRGGTPSGAA